MFLILKNWKKIVSRIYESCYCLKVGLHCAPVCINCAEECYQNINDISINDKEFKVDDIFHWVVLCDIY